jgi:leucyl aminopeptidase
MLKITTLVTGLFLSSSALALDVQFASGALPTGGNVAVMVADRAKLSGAAAQIDAATQGALSRALNAASFDGSKAESSLSLMALGGYERIIVLGAGKTPAQGKDWEDVGGRAAEAFKDKNGTLLAESANAAQMAAAGLGAELNRYSFTAYKSDKKAPAANSFTVQGAEAAAAKSLYASRHAAIVEGVTFARDLISTPSNIKSPAWFVEQAQGKLRGMKNVSITVLDEKEMARLGMGMIVGSGQGSSRPPRMLIMRYTGAGTAAPLALVGKGITFDTGGVSLKDPADMWRMRYDMSGAAAVTGTLLAAAKAELPVNLVAVAALSENMPDGNAIRPGDVLKAYSGKTVEVQNTDAEGRLVLGDANWYAQEQYKPHTLINIATLTGSARNTFGDDYAALFATDEALADKLLASGKESGEPLWRLPVDDSHTKDIKSDVADINNISGGTTGGASVGAAFIKEFIKPETKWAHLDIAGTAWRDVALPTAPKGAAGFGVRLFMNYIMNGKAK